MAQATLPIAPLIAIDTGLVGFDHRGELGKGPASVMPERFIYPGRLGDAFGLDQIEAAQNGG